jgi:hypothetical protein
MPQPRHFPRLRWAHDGNEEAYVAGEAGRLRHHQASSGIILMHLVCWDVCAGKQGRVEILRPRPRRGVGQRYSSACGLMSCLDGLKAPRPSWTDAPHRRPLDIAVCMTCCAPSLPLLESPCLRCPIGHARRFERLSGSHSELPVHCGCMMRPKGAGRPCRLPTSQQIRQC